MLSTHRDSIIVITCGIAIALMMATFAILSPPYGVPGIERPVLLLVGILIAAFVLSLLAIGHAAKLPDRRAVFLVMGFGLLFRLLLLPSHPFQEVDLYRYIWDGYVSEQGISPFAYAPQTIRDAESADALLDLDGVRVAGELKSPIRKVLDRVHFAQLRTPYPPVSQTVFYATALLTPDTASLRVHVVIMKAIVCCFDIGALLLLISLLRSRRMPAGLAVAYGWNPLVLKEFANSGHLDAIAVFFSILTVTLMTRWLWPLNEESSTSSNAAKRDWLMGISTAVSAGLSVGAKFYPVVLFPLLMTVVWKRRDWKTAMLTSTLAGISSVTLIAPMFMAKSELIAKAESPAFPGDMTQVDDNSGTNDSGLAAFVRSWEINDFLFLIVVENLKPQSPSKSEVWFSVVPDSSRHLISSLMQSMIGEHHVRPAFAAARIITLTVFSIVALWLCAGFVRDATVERWLEGVFLTLAWFWLLAPTQNPWYWIWALVFVPFASSRSWQLFSGFALIYYLRFWFGYHYQDLAVGWTSYQGTEFFDLVITWFEFLPPLSLLMLESYLQRRKASGMSGR